jgi:hypothetical protein
MPDKFYTNQSTTIRAVTNRDLASATDVRMYYERPDETGGYWEAAVQEGYKVVYNTATNDINQAGLWTFYPYVVVGGLLWQGESFTQRFYNPGE